METIKNYLDNMFANLPDTSSVKRAKDELYQMMEDKYNELISEGMSDNAAVGTVISEFGNLDEIAQELGIESVVESPNEEGRRTVSFEEVKEFLDDSKKRAFRVALGVALCIMSVSACIIPDAITENPLVRELGVSMMFIMIAVGVILFIYTGAIMKKWDFIEKQACSMDMATVDFVKEAEAAYAPKHALLLAIGVALCIISVVPASIFDEIDDIITGPVRVDDLGGVCLFVFVAIGVFFIVYSGVIKGSFEELFKGIARKTEKVENESVEEEKGSGNVYVDDERSGLTYVSSTAETIMEVFWPTVTCIYMCWSFLTFDWFITWIIWPIAAVLHVALKSILTKRS
ncbi:MAG: permease prefix domain 1-containing protein [Lachnospiraceae bacterium]|nr:permease prefix domain 1-containing protein [Lachnospiraceae bacterium]